MYRAAFGGFVLRQVRLGPFVVLDTIGLGAMGTVYHACHDDSGARVAIKVVRPDAASDPFALSNLTSEIRAVAALDHPNIIRIFDVGLVSPEEAGAAPDRLIGGTPWFAMEVADQGSLRRRLRGLDAGEVHDVLLQLLDALAHAHARGILHLDLKPQNVLFAERSSAPILSDFGMGVVGDPDPTGDFVRGTPHFMAPEQVRGRWEELGPWTDLYALGCLAWLATTGRTPMPEGDPGQILTAQLDRDPGLFEPVVEVPPGFEAWVRRLLAKDPDRRPRCAADAARELLGVLGRPAPERIPEDWRASEDEAAADPGEATGMGLVSRREPPLVGRTRERTELWRALRAAADGAPRVVVVRGPRGTGKSRLARWLGVRAAELGSATALSAASGATDPLHSALSRAFPLDLRDWDAEAGLGTRLTERGLSSDVAGRAAAWIAHGGARGAASFDVLCDVLRAVTTDRPAVVWLDDVHRAPDVLRFAHHLLARRSQLPVVLMLTVDDEQAPDAVLRSLEELGRLPGAAQLELGPLSEQARHHLARRMLPLDPGLAYEVADRSGGSPGFTVELLQELANKGVLAHSHRGLTLPPGMELGAPAGQLEASETQLLPLLREHPEWERPLRIAAALGARVDEGQWRGVCERAGVPLPDGLAAALAAGRVWRRDGVGWRFLQPATVESLAAGLTDEAVHRWCAEALTDTDPVQAGVEWERAGEPGAALDAWLTAGARLSGPALLPVLGRVRGVAGNVLGRGDPRVLQVATMASECALALGWLREARDAAGRMLESAETDADRQRARVLLAAVAVEDQDGRGLATLLREVSRGPLVVGDRWQAPWRVAWAWRQLGRVEPGRTFLRSGPTDPEHLLETLRYDLLDGASPGTVLPKARELGASPAREVRAAAAQFEGVAAWVDGRVDAAAAAFRAARRRYRALGFECDERVARAWMLLSFGAGQEDEALRLLEQERPRATTARGTLALDVVEVLLRLPRPKDLRFGAAATSLERQVARGGMLDAELALVLRSAARRAERSERAEALGAVLAARIDAG